MGLDQSGFLGGEKVIEDNSIGIQGGKDVYWRKHARLQEFMSDLWDGKGSEGSFNCSLMELTKEDLLQLKEAIGNGYKEYECSGGFFWGHQFQEEVVKEYEEQDLDFVNEALYLVECGDSVHYSCWY